MLACPSCGSVYTRSQEYCGLDGHRLVDVLEDPLIGRTVGRYVIHQPLGAGGMARVYRGKHEVLERFVAVKVLHGELSADQHLGKRFEREARSLSRIRHPNVVEVLDFGRTEAGLLYMVMEYVEGWTLAEGMRRFGPIAPAEAARILGQLTRGIQAAHASGYVHRDLKPQNIVLNSAASPPGVKILDFGLVGLVEGHTSETPLTRQGTFFGTPTYMSPEQAAGEPAGPPADLYALGVILYEMITASPPFVGDVRQLAHQHIHVEPPRPPLEYGGLTDLALRLLAKAPESRPLPERLLEDIDRLEFSLPPTVLADAPHPDLAAPPERAPSRGRALSEVAAQSTPQEQAAGREPQRQAQHGPGPAAELAVPIDRDEFSVLDGTSRIYEREALGATRRARWITGLVLLGAVTSGTWAFFRYPPTPSASRPENQRPEVPSVAPRPTLDADDQRGSGPPAGIERPTKEKAPMSYASFLEADVALGRRLSKQGLAWSALETAEPSAARQWGRWYRAERAVDHDSFQAVKDTLENALTKLSGVEHPQLVARLVEVRSALRARAPNLAPRTRETLERRLAKLDAAIRAEPLESPPRALLAGLEALFADIQSSSPRAR